jgi:hypothetical protein
MMVTVALMAWGACILTIFATQPLQNLRTEGASGKTIIVKCLSFTAITTTLATVAVYFSMYSDASYSAARDGDSDISFAYPWLSCVAALGVASVFTAIAAFFDWLRILCALSALQALAWLYLAIMLPYFRFEISVPAILLLIIFLVCVFTIIYKKKPNQAMDSTARAR